MNDETRKSLLIPGERVLGIKINREDIEEYIDPYQDSIDLLFKQSKKARRKGIVNHTYGGWKLRMRRK